MLICSLFITPVTSAALIKTADTVFLASARTNNQETDRLYKDMGVLKIPRILIPDDIQLTDLNGRSVRLSDFKGKIVFLNFWTTWCPTCRFEMPSMQKLYAKLKDDDFAIVGIDLQEPISRVKAFVEEFKLTFTILLDSNGDAGRLFGIRSIPTTFILDKDGGIIGKALGPREWNSNKSIAFFEHLMNHKTDKLSYKKGTWFGSPKDRELGNTIRNAEANKHK